MESRGRPPFPRLSSEWWFGCVTSNLAQRALSGSLKENGQTTLASENQERDIDWSFYAGLDENKRILDTHISDHKPQALPNGTKSFEELPMTNSFDQNNFIADRIGLYKPTTSSAISQADRFGRLLTLFAVLTSTLLVTFEYNQLAALVKA